MRLRSSSINRRLLTNRRHGRFGNRYSLGLCLASRLICSRRRLLRFEGISSLAGGRGVRETEKDEENTCSLKRRQLFSIETKFEMSLTAGWDLSPDPLPPRFSTQGPLFFKLFDVLIVNTPARQETPEKLNFSRSWTLALGDYPWVTVITQFRGKYFIIFFENTSKRPPTPKYLWFYLINAIYFHGRRVLLTKTFA